jgi:hypothetical protein
MSRRARVVTIILALLTAVACVVLFGYIKYVRVMGHVESLRQHLHSLEARGDAELLYSLQTEELEAVHDELVQVGTELKGLKSELGPALAIAPYLGWFPFVGGDLAAGANVLEMGMGVSAAGDFLFRGLEPLFPLLGGSEDFSPDTSVGEAVAAAVSEGQPDFLAAQVELERVGQLRQRIDEGRLSPELDQLLGRLDRYLPLLETGVEGLLVAPSLLGVDEPRTYLMLAQNEHELRATGGFISSVALLGVADGKVAQFDFRDSYAVDDLSQPHPDAPEALERYMLAQIWLLRDANWYPGFPASAQVARDLYQLDQGVLVDGVIAVDLTAMQSFVGALEPVYLEEYDEEVTEANVLGLMEEHWASPSGEGQTGDWWAHRKDFMGELLGAMMAKLETDVGSVDAGRLARALLRGLEEKHVLVYVVDPTVGAILSERGWDGAIGDSDGDFLMVVDTNMGFNKVNPNVERSVEYQVSIEDEGGITSRVAVTYRNRSGSGPEECVQEAVYPPTYREMMEGCYWNYLRIYVPEESELVQGPQLTLPEGSLRARQDATGGASLGTEVGPAESGKSVCGVFFVVAPGERREMVFEYEQPSSVLVAEEQSETYRLLVQKQPGTLAVPLRVEVELPSGSSVISVTPEARSLANGHVVFETDLRQDREFEVIFRR